MAAAEFQSSPKHRGALQASIRLTASARVWLQGITQKHVLFGLSSGAVVGIDKRFLDAKRPLPGAKGPKLPEGLPPYQPMLNFSAVQVPVCIAGWSLCSPVTASLVRQTGVLRTRVKSTTTCPNIPHPLSYDAHAHAPCLHPPIY